MEKWNEIHTAYQVAKLGTVSAAAETLGVHRATVIRHVDALEAHLGDKLFHRHSRGYAPTEAGLDLLRVARATDEQLGQLVLRSRGRAAELSGELVITSVEIIAPAIVASLERFHADHPKTILRYVVSPRLLKLEYGEAHIAVRSGPHPEDQDNVVQPFPKMRSGLYAHRRYIEAHGLPKTQKQLAKHAFIGTDGPQPRDPLHAWLEETIAPERIIFRSAKLRIRFEALQGGMGIAFYPEFLARKNPDLVQVVAPKTEWDVQFWLVTHVDLHRTPKVQAILQHLKRIKL